MKKIISLLFVMALPFVTTFADEVTVDKITYKLYNDEGLTASVSGSVGYSFATGSQVTIPEQIYYRGYNYTVNKIEHFSSSNVVDLVLPSTIVSIADVERGVKTLHIPASVTSITGMENCNDLMTFEVADGNASFCVVDRALCSKDKKKLYYMPHGRSSITTAFVVPSGVEEIGDHAFYSFNELETVKFPEGLKVIGVSAFGGTELSSINLPESLEEIGESAFSLYSSRTIDGLVLGKDIISIGDNAFGSLTFKTITCYMPPVDEIGESAFDSSSKLVVPIGTRDLFSTRKGWKKFNDIVEGDFSPTYDVNDYPAGSKSLDYEGQSIKQDGITYNLYSSGGRTASVYADLYSSFATGSQVTIPEQIYYRGYNYTVNKIEHFSSSNVVDLVLPSTIVSIADVERGVKTLHIPASVTSITGMENCNDLMTFEVADGNASFCVVDRALCSKDKKKLYYMPHGLCSSVSEVVIPSDVINIGEYAFNGFSNLKSLTLPVGLKDVGQYAFDNAGVTFLILPASLQNIADCAFNFRSSRTIFYSENKAPNNIGTNNALGSESNVTVYVPIGKKSVYLTKEGWKNYTIEETEFITSIKLNVYRDTEDKINMEADMDGATIYYTLDGSEPTTASTVYSKPFTPTRNSEIKVYAYKEGSSFNMNSPVKSFIVDWLKCDVVKFSCTGNMLTLTTTTPDATIYYEMGEGVTPTEESPKYKGAITLTADCEVSAIAVKTGWHDSDVSTKSFKKADLQCKKVDFSRTGNTLTLSTEEPDATIYYAFDATPTDQSLQYTEPITLTQNCVVKAIAIKADWMNSDVIEYSVNDFKCDVVKFSCTGNKLTLTTTTPDATIYYEMGEGVTPTEESPKYKGAITLTADCEVSAIAVKTGWHDSDVSTKSFKKADLQCKKVDFSRTGNTLTLSTEEPDATIYYAFDATPTDQSLQYTEPITLTQNCVVKAIAIKADWMNSDVIEYSVNDFKCDVVKFSCTGNKLTLTTTTPDATIYYEMGEGVTPTEESPKYKGAITLTADCEVSAIAVKTGWHDSDVSTKSFKKADLQCKKVDFSRTGNTLTLSTEEPDATIYYAFDATPTDQSLQYTEPITLTNNRPVNAIVIKKGWLNSDISAYTPTNFKCEKVTLVSFDGRHFTLNTTTPDAMILYSIDGSDPEKIYEGKTLVTDICTLKAKATADYMNPSDVMTEKLDYCLEGTTSKLGSAGKLEASLATQDKNTLSELTIDGKINATDIAFIRSLGSLVTLDMENVELTGGILPDQAFKDMHIRTFISPQDVTTVGQKLFEGCSKIAAIIWKDADTPIPANAFDGQQNPNLLLYVANASLAPSVIKNVITPSGANITLTDGDGNTDFYCPQSFKATKISYSHSYTKETPSSSGSTSGWESIALPFDVSSITFKGYELMPTKKYEKEGRPNNARPFLLREMTSAGFEDVSEIKANKPYIICMPNNERYVESYRIKGTVTFSATDVEVPETNPQTSVGSSESLKANFSLQSSYGSIFAINEEGSMFVRGLRAVRPFEAFAITPSLTRSFIGIGGDDTTDIYDILQNMAESDPNATVKVYSTSGILLKQGKRSEVLQQLPKGIYIINGKKIVK